MKRSTNISSTIVWRAEEYNNLSFAQDSAAEDFIQQLHIGVSDFILDVGCGNGKISAKLSKIAENGQVLGLDISPEMIDFASENFPQDAYLNLKFKIQDAQNLSYKNQFSIVFSSFALQWIENKNLFFQKAYKALKKNGTLALIVPTGISPELEASIHSIINLPKWKEYFEDFHPNWFFSDSQLIKHLVIENLFKINYFQASLQEVTFPSRESFERYILLWFPYLKPLPNNLKIEFFNEVLEEYFRLLPVKARGSVLMRIPRVDIIAKKLSFN